MRSGLVCLTLPALVAACGHGEPDFSSSVRVDPACGEVEGDVVVIEAGCEAAILLTAAGIDDRAAWELNVVLPGQPDAFYEVPADGGLALSWTPEPVPGQWRASAGPMRFELASIEDRGDESWAFAFDTLVIDPARAPGGPAR